MFKKMENRRGFTLIELMIVVAIIGILAAIAIPNFMKYQCKSRQAEAKTNLGAIFTSEEAYRAEWGGYTGDATAAGFEPSGTARYTYAASGADATTFTATATGSVTDIDGDATNDVWTINETKTLANPTNDCAD